jgi:hypothetical protein
MEKTVKIQIDVTRSQHRELTMLSDERGQSLRGMVKWAALQLLKKEQLAERTEAAR